jgi:hypothetical protein
MIRGVAVPVLAEKCHPLWDQLVSPNNPKGVLHPERRVFERICVFGQHREKAALDSPVAFHPPGNARD